MTAVFKAVKGLDMKARPGWLLIPAVTVAVLLAVVSAQTGTAAMQANVTVPCTFKVNLLPSAAYLRSGNITINYTAQTLDGCTLSNVHGMLDLFHNQGSNVTLERSLNVSMAPSLLKGSVAVNSLSISLGIYNAKLTVTTPNYTNMSVAQFYLLAPPNVSITNFSVANAGQGAPLTFYLAIKNSGNYAASNVIAHVSVSGPQDYNFIVPFNATAGKSAAENATSQQTGMTATPGAYAATAYLTYTSDGSSYTSADSVAQYTVGTTSHPSSAPPPVSVPGIPGVGLTSVPLYVSSPSAARQVVGIEFNDTSPFNETVTIGVPEPYTQVAVPSASSARIRPGETIEVNLLLDPSSLAPGQYIIPINLTASTGGAPVYATDYLTYVVLQAQPSKPSISTEVELTNNTEDAYGTVLLKTPAGYSTGNSTFITYLPQALVRYASQISAFGMPNNITLANDYYAIRWSAGSIGPNQTVYGYFTIRNPSSQQLFAAVKSTLFAPIIPSSSVLRVLEVSAPTAYENATSTMTVELLYTGALPQQIYATLTGPSYSTIYNSSQTVNATPNQLIMLRFTQRIGSYNGTLMDQLSVYTAGASLNYSVPILSLAALRAPITTTISSQPAGIGSVIIHMHKYLVVTIIIVVVAAVAAGIIISARKPRYSIDRVHELSHIKERMKRNE